MSDLLVVGGGPAGLATALFAARAGLSVTVWDKRPGTIDKACGEGLMPRAVAALADLGVDPAGMALTGIRYVAPGCTAEAPFRAGPGRGVRRTTLHAALRTAALDAGVTLTNRCAHQVRSDATGVDVDGERFPYVVAADGLHSPIRRALGLDGTVPGRHLPRRYGLRAHFRVPAWTSYVEVHWAEGAECYVTPVDDALVGVALLTSRRGAFEEHLTQFPGLRERLRGAVGVGAVMGAGPLRQRASRRTSGRVLLVGDAAGYVDALTGEGVALAVAEARAAVEAIAAGDPTGYDRAWPALTRRYRLVTGSLLAVTRPRPLRRLLVPAAQRLPSVFGAAVNVVAEAT